MPNDFSSEALSILNASESNLTATVLDQELRVLLLTAANAGSGTTTAAMTLAGELARSSHAPVLLADASQPGNKHGGGLTCRLDLQKHPGFMDLVLPEAPPLAECIVHVEGLPFDVMPVGNRQWRSERLTPRNLHALFAQLGERYRFVVIDGEAVYGSPDTLAISTQVDGVVLVVRGEETRWEVARAAIQRLTQAGARLTGCIFNARRYYMPKWVYDHL
ncbi:MAG: CpsD/CapB family tyrosine-protein kinase [Zoogloeaceae bacterium]|jgi:Mrp family chromosome partitioning ATPase|nr:CpsD/CapB family tyrosine-protein kinase [Zoogloeaceae bacterium]